MRTPAGVANASTTATTLWDVNLANSIIYNVPWTINTNAEFVGWRTGETEPRYAFHSFGQGNTSLFFDAYVSGGVLLSGSSSYEGMRVVKAANNLYFQRLSGTLSIPAAQSPYTAYQNVLSVGAAGVNLYMPNSVHGSRAFASEALGTTFDYYGAYLDDSHAARSGSASQASFLIASGLGAWGLSRCAGTALGTPIGACTSAMSVDGSGVGFPVSVSLTGAPQLSTVLLPSSGGTGSTAAPLAQNGSLFIVSDPTGPEGKMVEFDGLNVSRIYSDQTNVALTMFVSGDSGSGPVTLTNLAQIRVSRFGQEVTYTVVLPSVPFNPNQGGIGSSTPGPYIDMTATPTLIDIVVAYPWPDAVFCLQQLGTQIGPRSMTVCMNGDVTRFEYHLNLGEGVTNYLGGTVYELPRTTTFTYRLDVATE